jgi:Flp pilus assembly protein TadB
VLALTGANAASVVLFGALYAVAGARMLPQPAFLLCLAVLFVLMTVLWVRIEARHRRLDALRRLGRIAGGLLLVVVATPMAVLGPLFWLDQQLPVEAGLHAARGGVMALVLIALVLVTAVNVTGLVVAVIRALLDRRPAAKRP